MTDTSKRKLTKVAMTKQVLFVLLWLVAGASAVADESESICYALFVQNAGGLSTNGTSITLKNVSPTVIYFCDRPERMAGHLGLEAFLKSVSSGENSFADDPPNAVLSVLSGDDYIDVVVELSKEPRLDGRDLVYEGIRVIEGELPDAGGPSSLFIDRIGRPMSPVSVAGVHRRHVRHRVRSCAAGVTCW